MSEAFVFFLHGLAYAGLLFLVSLGPTLVFGMMNVLNFAHAALYMMAPIWHTLSCSTAAVSCWPLSSARLCFSPWDQPSRSFFLRRIHFEADESNSVFRYLFKSSLFKLNN